MFYGSNENKLKKNTSITVVPFYQRNGSNLSVTHRHSLFLGHWISCGSIVALMKLHSGFYPLHPSVDLFQRLRLRTDCRAASLSTDLTISPTQSIQAFIRWDCSISQKQCKPQLSVLQWGFFSLFFWIG